MAHEPRDDKEEESFMERWYSANANKEYIGVALADLVRRLMRASINGSGANLYEASNQLATLLNLIRHAGDATTYEIVSEAVEQLRVPVDYSSSESPTLLLAQDATLYLLERSSTDGFAAARLSKRQDKLRRAIKSHDEERREILDRNRS